MKRIPLPTLSRLSYRERLLVAASLLTVGIVVLDRLVLKPWWRSTQQIRQEIRSLERAIIADRTLLNRKDAIMAKAHTYPDSLPSEEGGEFDMAVLLRALEVVGRESGISLGEVKPLSGTSAEGSEARSLEIHCEGTLQQWIPFIYLLETSNSLFDIEQATLAPTTPGHELLEGSLRLTPLVLTRPPPASDSSQAEQMHGS